MYSPNPPVEATQRIREWQPFLDATVHDLRTPLRGIGISVEFLLETCGERLDEDAKKFIRTILDGVARLDNLSKALARYSRALQIGGTPSGRIRIERALRASVRLWPQWIHPAIAKLFDAGSMLKGTPYFVMEYVAGVPITT